jgi:hypothetical protein
MRRAQSTNTISAPHHNNGNDNDTPPLDPDGVKKSSSTGKIQIRRCTSNAGIPYASSTSAGIGIGMPRVESRSSFKQPGSHRNSIPKNVSFHQIEIREFPMELGDNPSAIGAPITIGWEPQANDILEFDEYEAAKEGVAREKSQLRMPAKFRAELLQNQGTTMKQIMDVQKQSKKIQKARVDSIKSMRWDNVNEKLESARRTVKKVASNPFSVIHMSKRSPTVQVVPIAQGEHDDDDDDDDDNEGPLKGEDGPLMF